MKPQSDIASYVSDLRRRLHLPPEVQERIVAEAEAHLQDRTTAHVAQGMDRRDAESLAVAEFGPVWRVALRFRLAYLDVKKVLAWAGALLLIAHRVYGFLSVIDNPRLASQRITIVAVMFAGPAVFLIVGFAVRAVFPRRLILGAGILSLALSALDSWRLIRGLHRYAGSQWAGHIWNGWQSGFCAGNPHIPHRFVLYSDISILLGTLSIFAWTLMGVWAAGAIRAKIAQRRGGHVVA